MITIDETKFKAFTLKEQSDGTWCAFLLNSVSFGTQEATAEEAIDSLMKAVADLVNERNDQLFHVMTNLNFGQAIDRLKRGVRLARAGWNGKGMWLALQVPDAHSKMGLPYIYMSTVGGKLVPWLASQTDMLADDWNVIEDDREKLGRSFLPKESSATPD